MAKNNELPGGCLFRRGKRWWYKLPGNRRYPCTPDGASMATTQRSVALVIARRIWEQLKGQQGSISEIVQRWHQADSLACCDAHATEKLRVVKHFLDVMKIESPMTIMPRTITDYMATLGQEKTRISKDGKEKKVPGDSRKTIANKRAILGRFCQWLKDQGELMENPVRQTRGPKIARTDPVHLTRMELGRALWMAKRQKLWSVFFAAYTGVRLSEMRRVTWGDIRQGPNGKIIVIREAKANQPRSLPVSRRLASVLARMKPGAPDELLFPEHGPRWWNRQLRAIRKAVPKIDRDGGGWHDFRRTVGSLLVQKGYSIYTVAKVLGHSDIKTTARYYAHLDAEAGRDALDSL